MRSIVLVFLKAEINLLMISFAFGKLMTLSHLYQSVSNYLDAALT